MIDEADASDEVEEATDDLDASPADELLDELFPEDLDWRRLVRSYPRVALLAAAAVGFLVGRRRGSELLSGFLETVTQRVGDTVEEMFGTTLDDAE